MRLRGLQGDEGKPGGAPAPRDAGTTSTPWLRTSGPRQAMGVVRRCRALVELLHPAARGMAHTRRSIARASDADLAHDGAELAGAGVIGVPRVLRSARGVVRCLRRPRVAGRAAPRARRDAGRTGWESRDSTRTGCRARRPAAGHRMLPCSMHCRCSASGPSIVKQRENEKPHLPGAGGALVRTAGDALAYERRLPPAPVLPCRRMLASMASPPNRRPFADANAHGAPAGRAHAAVAAPRPLLRSACIASYRAGWKGLRFMSVGRSVSASPLPFHHSALRRSVTRRERWSC